MRIVVTGGAGFIGANLCRRLVDSGSDVVVVDDLSTGHRENLDGLDVRFVHGSVTDDDVLDDAFLGADTVVHLAALGSVPRSVEDPVTTHHVNVTGTLTVLEAARRHGGLHTLLAGSSSVYGANPTIPKHEQLATRPISPYGASKLAAEAYVLAHAAAYDLPVMSFRFFNVFGPLQRAGHVYAAVIPAFVDAALRDETLVVHGDGTQSRDFTYVGSLTAVIADVIERRVSHPEPVNLAFGTRTSLLEVIDQLEEIIGHPIERCHVATRAGDVPHSQADNTVLRSLVPDVDVVPFADGLRATVEWMRSTLDP